MKEGNENTECKSGLELCRMRSSVLPIVSGLLFFAALASFLHAGGSRAYIKERPPVMETGRLGDQRLANARVDTTEADETIRAIERSFHWGVYFPFVSMLCLHLLRLYLSCLVIDEDPSFYYRYLRPLTRFQRGIEYGLRILIFGTLCLFVKGHVIRTGALRWVPLLSRTYFGVAVYLYAALLLWDGSMAWFHGVPWKRKARREDTSRLSFLFNDIIGLVMSIIMVRVWIYRMQAGDMLLWAFLMWSLCVLSLVFLFRDLLKNRAKYVEHFRRGLQLPCSEHPTLVPSKCPVAKSVENSREAT